MNYMVEGFLADWTGLSQAQARTLILLHRVGTMNYAIVEDLELFPRSKMRERVLDPLYANGWIQFYRNAIEIDSPGGRPSMAWGLVEDRKPELSRLIESAESVSQQRLDKAIDQGLMLTAELLASKEDYGRRSSKT